jgi:uncharacterized membrane protein
MLRRKTNDVASFGPAPSQGRLLGIRYFLVLWPLFFAICFGLGYPTLRRYDPRLTEGLSDTSKYYAIITGADQSNFKEMFRCRVLVPYVGRPFYWFAQTYLHTWNPGFFGLLMSSALFCATTACLVVSIGNRLLNDLGTALLGATLYLLSFTIPNLQLVGLIDAGEACFMAAVIWSLLTRRWFLLPIWGLLGALAKETFVPFSCVFAFTWWFVEGGQNTRRLSGLKWTEFKWIATMAVVGLATVMAVHSAVAGNLKWPWNIAGQARAPVNFFVALGSCLTERSFWYVFGWLIPLGIWRLRYFPKPWLVASIATSILAIMLGAYSNAGGTVGRATFNIIGPLLSLSVALLIARPSEYMAPLPTAVANPPSQPRADLT